MSTTKFCPRCEQALPAAAFNRNIGRRDGLSVYCTECYRLYGQQMRDRLKAAAFAYLGGVCARCGFSDERALQVDHVNGDGVEHRKGQRPDLYREVVRDTTGRFQLLCANCNWIKMVENGERGNRVYKRLPPLEEIVKRPHQQSTPEGRAAQSEKSRKGWANLTDEQRAKISAQRSASMKARWARGEVPNRPKD